MKNVLKINKVKEEEEKFEILIVLIPGRKFTLRVYENCSGSSSLRPWMSFFLDMKLEKLRNEMKLMKLEDASEDA